MKIIYFERRRQRIKEWHRYFAWFPMYADEDHTLIWLEHIERKGKYAPAGDFSGWEFELGAEMKIH